MLENNSFLRTDIIVTLLHQYIWILTILNVYKLLYKITENIILHIFCTSLNVQRSEQPYKQVYACNGDVIT